MASLNLCRDVPRPERYPHNVVLRLWLDLAFGQVLTKVAKEIFLHQTSNVLVALETKRKS